MRASAPTYDSSRATASGPCRLISPETPSKIVSSRWSTRSAGEVRHIFTRFGGNLGTTGAVAWQFERRGVVLVPAGDADEDELFLAAADAGADDLEQDGDVFQVTSAPENLAAVREAIESAGFEIESAELAMLPKTTVAIADEGKARQLMRLIDALEDNEDVQDVYANFDIPEQVLEAAAT